MGKYFFKNYIRAKPLFRLSSISIFYAYLKNIINRFYNNQIYLYF